MQRITMITIGWLLGSSSAFAEDTGDTGSSTEDSGSESTTGGTEDDSSDDACGSCTTASTMTSRIASPADGATVSSPFTVQATATPECYCDDCGCADFPVRAQRILVDGVVQGADCEAADCTFEISAAAGAHEITLEAEYTYESVRTSITVTVGEGEGEDAEGSSGEGPEDTGDTGGSSDGAQGGTDPSKGGCTIDPTAPAPAGAMGLGLLVLAMRRRRR